MANARMATIYRVLRLDDEGFWTDVPGGNDFRSLEDSKAEATHCYQRTRQRTRVVDSHSHCCFDSKFLDEEGLSKKEAMGS